MGVRKDEGESSLGVDMRQAEHVLVQFNGSVWLAPHSSGVELQISFCAS